jgi:hypothetical protein
MRQVIQRTVRTTKIISLTMTHSESEEAVEYALIDGVDQSAAAIPDQTEQPPRLDNPAETASDRSDPNPTTPHGEHDELAAQLP